MSGTPTSSDVSAGLVAPTAVAPSSAGSVRGVGRLTGGSSVLPLVVLFGLAAVEAMNRATGQVLLPEIRDAFQLTDAAVLGVATAALQFGLFLTVPVAARADRGHRVRLALTGGAVFAAFSLVTGVVPLVWYLFLATRLGAAFGQATILPTHNSLLADYYDVPHRPAVYAFHRGAEGLGLFLGFVAAGLLGQHLGWRFAFVFLAVPTIVLLVLGRRLREPARGHHERRAMGVSGQALDVQEEPASLEEAQRIVNRIESVRRLFVALPFLAVSYLGFGLVTSLYYEKVFGLTVSQRGLVEAIAELGQIAGVVTAAVVGTRLLRRDPALLIRALALVAAFTASMIAVFAFAPSLPVAVAARVAIAAGLAMILPSVFAVVSMAVPPRVRATGFSMAVLSFLPGLLLVPLVGWLGDTWGIRWGISVLAPILLVGGYLAATASRTLNRDIRAGWAAGAARAHLLAARHTGQIKQLLVEGLDVKYGDVQILFGVDLDIDQGEIVALLGTNGAGKSTLLRAITGVVQASQGSVVFDGRDITSSPPHEIATFGIAMVPGGQGVFPSLTVSDNLRVADWQNRTAAGRKKAPDPARIDKVLATFPVLRERLDEPAANLSGGQQQMLALGMAFLARPRLLLIDELSLGLAPVIVEQLLAIVRAIRDQGTTVILVEQSVNVALTLAETAYFMEKGEIRFHGPTAELLERPDVLRSVFLEGAAAHIESGEEGPGDGRSNGDGASPMDRVAARPVHAPPGDGRAPERAAPVLELQDLSVRFGGIQAVSGVSLQVAPGEIVGMIGPNGAGKTTLFDLISGYSRADGGSVCLSGSDVTNLGPDARARRGLGRSFQDARLFPAMTVEETIKVAFERHLDVRDPFNAMLRLPVQQDSEAALQHRVDELVELMGIESFRAKFVSELSTGSRRVVDLACVLAHRPSVVLLDEPSSGIAQREAEALGPLIRRIRDALGACVLIIEHDMPLVSSVSDRLVALDQGRLVVEGPAEEVLNHPEVVASYLGGSDQVIARSGHRVGS